MYSHLLYLTVCLLVSSLQAASNNLPDPHKQTWGYITVRENAKMFYWLSCAGTTETYMNYPLIVWLQGGPGASSTGVGNFEEIGALDINMKFREFSWINKTNVLYIDSPVGAGFSYINQTAKNSSYFATNITQVVDDLMAFTTVFFQKNPEFQKIPLHIFGEGYGGTVATRYSYALYKAMNTGKMPCKIMSVTLGNAWISPLDSIKSWGKFLFSTSFVDSKGQEAIEGVSNKLEALLIAGNYSQALDKYFVLIDLIKKLTNGVSFFNILDTGFKTKSSSVKDACTNFNTCYASPELTKFMNEKIKAQLAIIPPSINWGAQAPEVLEALKLDYLKPSIQSVDLLLNRTNLKVAVYTSQLDILVNPYSTVAWIDRLAWPGLPTFKTQPRKPFIISDKSTAGFSTRYKTLTVYWLLKSGHMTGKNSGEAAMFVLDDILSG